MSSAPSPAAAYVPRLPQIRAPHFLEKAAAPRAWSWCSWDRKITAIEAGSTPAASSRSDSSRQPRPASTSTRTPADSTRVALPELPDPRTRSRMAEGIIAEGGSTHSHSPGASVRRAQPSAPHSDSDAELGGLRAVAAEVAEHAHRHLAREQVARDAGHVLGAHPLDAGEDLVEQERAAEVDLLPGEVAHPAPGVLEREHEAALQVVLGPAQLFRGEGLALHAPQLLQAQPD